MFLQGENIMPGMEKLEEKTVVLSEVRTQGGKTDLQSKCLKTYLDCCIQSSTIIHFFCHNTLDDALNFHFVGVNHSKSSEVGATILNLKKIED